MSANNPALGIYDEQTAIERLRIYLAEIWKCRYFWTSMAMNDLRARYRRSVLGIGWSLLNPIAMTAVLCIAFHQIFHVSIRDYAPFLMTGMAIWAYISTSLSDGCQTFYRSEGYIRSHAAPLGIYPLRVTIGVAIHFALTLLVTVAVTIAFKGVPSLLPLLSLIPSLILLFLFGWAVAVLFGAASVYFPDTQHLATIGLQILFYLTPVMYPPEIAAGKGLGVILKYNPIGSFVRLIRDPILDGRFPDMMTYLVAGSLSGILALLALYVIIKLQNHLIFHL